MLFRPQLTTNIKYLSYLLQFSVFRCGTSQKDLKSSLDAIKLGYIHSVLQVKMGYFDFEKHAQKTCQDYNIINMIYYFFEVLQRDVQPCAQHANCEVHGATTQNTEAYLFSLYRNMVKKKKYIYIVLFWSSVKQCFVWVKTLTHSSLINLKSVLYPGLEHQKKRDELLTVQ